jgi:DNA-binding transcriptional ArsR family regulator
MGLTKTEIFTDTQNDLAALARLFAHPARIAILQYLFEMEACICGDIVDEIGLAQPTVSQHLKELRLAGLIKGDVDGTRVCYCIDRDNWQQAKERFQSFLNQDLNLENPCCE